MTTTINGTTGVSRVQDGVVVQADLAANVVGNGPIAKAEGGFCDIPTGIATYTALPLDSVSFDSGGIVDTTNNIMVVPVTGFYQVRVLTSYLYAGILASTIFAAVMRGTDPMVFVVHSCLGGTGYPAIEASGLVYLAAGQSIYAAAKHNAAGMATNVTCSLEMHLARAA